jgi:hypothetical protein
MIKMFAALFVTVALAVGASAHARADSPVTGGWSLATVASQLRLEISWSNADGTSHDNSSVTVDPAALGIGPALASSGQHIRFTLHREAGDFTMEGWVGNQQGGGTYTFEPNAAFFDALRARGFTISQPQDEVAAAELDVTLEFVDDVRRAGVNPEFHDLLAFRALGVDGAYIRDMAAVGFAHLEPHQLIEMRALHIDRAYVEAMRAQGVADLDAHSVVELKALHIDGGYLQELAANGYPHLTARDYVQLKALRIDGDYVKKLASHGYTHLTVQQLISYKALHIE